VTVALPKPFSSARAHLLDRGRAAQSAKLAELTRNPFIVVKGNGGSAMVSSSFELRQNHNPDLQLVLLANS